jgi:hypothetical protein
MKARSKAITTAASEAAEIARRFGAVERDAQFIFAQSSSRKVARAVMNGSGLHAIISDGMSTVEICNGTIAVNVTQPMD